MDEFCFQRTSHVPAFGSWECYGDLPFTQCFETAMPAGLLRYTYSGDRDLCVTGDLYENDIHTPAMIVVPRHAGKKGYPKEKEVEKGNNENWVGCDCECEVKRSEIRAPKAVDEDLYKISPHLLRHTSKRKRGWGIIASCLRPTCVC